MISNCFGFVQNCFCSCCHYYYSVDFIIAQGDLDLVYFSFCLLSAEITSVKHHIQLTYRITDPESQLLVMVQ